MSLRITLIVRKITMRESDRWRHLGAVLGPWMKVDPRDRAFQSILQVPIRAVRHMAGKQ